MCSLHFKAEDYVQQRGPNGEVLPTKILRSTSKPADFDSNLVQESDFLNNIENLTNYNVHLPITTDINLDDNCQFVQTSHADERIDSDEMLNCIHLPDESTPSDLIDLVDPTDNAFYKNDENDGHVAPIKRKRQRKFKKCLFMKLNQIWIN